MGLLLAAGCRSTDSGTRKVIVTGSTTILPLAEVAADEYNASQTAVAVLVSGGGSSAGIEDVADGSSDIGTSSRELKDEEKELGLVDTPICYDAIAVIVNPGNPVRDLTIEQVRAIFTGQITNWNEVGGPDLDIGLVNRDEASGTREAFKKKVMSDSAFDKGAVVLPGTGQVREVVSEVKGAVGYISAGFVSDDVVAIAIDGVQPTEAAVVAETYPVQRVLHFFTKGEPNAEASRYIEYVLSPAVQENVVRKAGFIPITAKENSDG